MQEFFPAVFTAVTLASLCACAHGKKESSTPPPAAISKLEGQAETFTGRVALVAEGYRLKLSESEEFVRLTRAKKRSELVAEEISLKKYYDKTLAVRGKRDGDWIWNADIVGQWLRPGESRGPNLTAPDVGPQQQPRTKRD